MKVKCGNIWNYRHILPSTLTTCQKEWKMSVCLVCWFFLFLNSLPGFRMETSDIYTVVEFWKWVHCMWFWYFNWNQCAIPLKSVWFSNSLLQSDTRDFFDSCSLANLFWNSDVYMFTQCSKTCWLTSRFSDQNPNFNILFPSSLFVASWTLPILPNRSQSNMVDSFRNDKFIRICVVDDCEHSKWNRGIYFYWMNGIDMDFCSK